MITNERLSKRISGYNQNKHQGQLHVIIPHYMPCIPDALKSKEVRFLKSCAPLYLIINHVCKNMIWLSCKLFHLERFDWCLRGI